MPQSFSYSTPFLEHGIESLLFILLQYRISLFLEITVYDDYHDLLFKIIVLFHKSCAWINAGCRKNLSGIYADFVPEFPDCEANRTITSLSLTMLLRFMVVLSLLSIYREDLTQH